uniref:Uncharacterized protein n=1 Tax=viral metagenome TaxID=1070528 RepID=A0A6M3JN66_9ZZZZ
MSEAEAKAIRNEDSVRQEQAEVKAQKDCGNVAYRIAREIDTICGDKSTGILWLCDCKGTDSDVFYLDSSDIAKALDERQKWNDVLGRYGVPIKVRFEIHFKRHRSHNKKYVNITEQDRGYSLKVARGNGRISTSTVGKGV